MNIKLQYQSELKKLSSVNDYKDLLNKGISRFGLAPTQDWKFFYLDESQDLISISSQVDLEEAIE